jgi:hypothetical protein
MWMHNLIQYINRIKINADLQIDSIDQYTSDISVIDASHMRYGDTLPIIPKISYETINLEDHSITITSSVNRLYITSEDEFVLLANGKYYKYSIAGGEFTEQGDVGVKVRRHHLNHFVLGDDGYYYGLANSFAIPVTHLATVCKYDSDFSATTSYEVADLYDEVYPDYSKYVMNSTNIYKYINTTKSSFLLDGTFVEELSWMPEDRMYFNGFDIGLESWNNRFIKTLRHDGNVYFLDQFLVPGISKRCLTYLDWLPSLQQHNVSIGEMDGNIVFARIIGKDTKNIHLTRMELI